MKEISISLTQMYSLNRKNQRYQWIIPSLSSIPWTQLGDMMFHPQTQQDIQKQLAMLCVKIMINYGDILGISLFESLYDTFRMKEDTSNSIIKSILLQGFLTSGFISFMISTVCSYLQNPIPQVTILTLNSISSVNDSVASILAPSIWDKILWLTKSAMQQCKVQKSPSELLNASLRAIMKYLPLASFSPQMEGILMEGVSILPLCTTREQLGIIQMLEGIPEYMLKELSSEVMDHVIMSFVFVVSRETRVVLKGLVAFATWVPYFPQTQLDMFVNAVELNQNALLLLPTTSVLSLLFVVLQRLDSLHVSEAPGCLSALLLKILQDNPENLVIFIHGYRRLSLSLAHQQELCDLIRSEIGNSEYRLSFLDVVAAKEVRIAMFP